MGAQLRGVVASRTRALETLGGPQVLAPVTRTPQRLRVRGRHRAAPAYGNRSHHAYGRLSVGRVADEHVFGVGRATVGHHGRVGVNRAKNTTARPAHFERVCVQHGGRLERGPLVVPRPAVGGGRPQSEPVQHKRGHIDGVRPVQRRDQPVIEVRLQRPEAPSVPVV